MIWNGQGNVDYSPRQESIRRECEASLRRLKTDVIDLYQIHWVLVQFLDKYMMYKCMMHLASALPALCRQYRYPRFRSGGRLPRQLFEVELTFLDFLC